MALEPTRLAVVAAAPPPAWPRLAHRSRWCRYINNAPRSSAANNLEVRARRVSKCVARTPRLVAAGRSTQIARSTRGAQVKINPHKGLVWFVASRDVEVGEELNYQYSSLWFGRRRAV